jgi:recombination protein RecR
MDNFRKLEEIFGHFPGIGPRQAKRFVYYILSRSNSTISEFVRLINETKKDSSECEKCHRLFIAQNSEGLCNICRDKSRDNSILMVVARDSDFETMMG